MRLRILLYCLISLLSAAADAESFQTSGPYTVHYNAVASIDLSAEVARQYAITRSDSRAVLNLAVREGELGSDRALSAEIRGSASNDVGQRQTLSFREVREGDALYYIAEPRMRSGDRLDFDLEVRPAGAAQPITIRFSRTLFGAR